ncbi:uncharacterized protein BYT42DRAFT_590121 [Radiomyces spectabilis]|uniref:uncharacterized protein n=1 Tax=Radiomyces spectabilis TaxID=64574 RepID=UPI00221E791E|nr:uncharacterized protein BYT42DRAFT_590121 [Radiomyces spectabilis]KAI8364710.1 hypothetical protein BYT42DRAFT_590121 [Radiomyces spectabilis]
MITYFNHFGLQCFFFFVTVVDGPCACQGFNIDIKRKKGKHSVLTLTTISRQPLNIWMSSVCKPPSKASIQWWIYFRQRSQPSIRALWLAAVTGPLPLDGHVVVRAGTMCFMSLLCCKRAATCCAVYLGTGYRSFSF